MVRNYIILVITGIILVFIAGTWLNLPNIPRERYGQINTGNCIIIAGLLAAIVVFARGMRKKQ